MTAIIFDFDDTLFETTHVKTQGNIREFITSEKRKALDKSIRDIIFYAKLFGNVFIITNASREWLEFCDKNFIPESGILSENIHFASEYCDSLTVPSIWWKTHAFNRLLPKFTHIINIGDSEFDRVAAFSMTNGRLIKNIKIDKSCFTNLVNAHDIIKDSLDSVWKSESPLDLVTILNKKS